ncbi:LOW QUALITY PROTEIN: phakinin [Erythrolamprus reginae]|uniref:LOW QUALITY PROTEIN: phakinin n=1 Tax=Erythrolamprus reginae TaxID=121349 RepID=UPI00396C75B7
MINIPEVYREHFAVFYEYVQHQKGKRRRMNSFSANLLKYSMSLSKSRASFVEHEPSTSIEEMSVPISHRFSISRGGSLLRPSAAYIGIIPMESVSSLGTRISRRALGISSVFLQGLHSSCTTIPLFQGLEKERSLSYENMNRCLVDYIEKVKTLEQVNQELEGHIRAYLNKKSSTDSKWGSLRESWATIYHQVGDAVLENARLMLQTESIQACAEDVKDRYENEQPFRKAVEDEINSLYKVIDHANLTKVDLESQIENMKKELALLSKNHEENIKMLYKQLALSPLEESEIPIGISLDDILKRIQIQWEKNIEQNYAETSILLHAKQSTETVPAVQTQVAELAESLRAEFHETACKIQSLQVETESLKTLKRGLENSLYDVKHWHDIELQNLGSVIAKLEAEVREIQGETEQQQRNHEALLSIKTELESDIAAYHCLLEKESRK